MHEVQTLSRFGVRPTTARTVWMLGFQRRRVRRGGGEEVVAEARPLAADVAVGSHGLLQRRVSLASREETETYREPRRSQDRERPAAPGGIARLSSGNRS